MAEALLPGTDAITNGTLEWDRYKGKWLVRYKERNGTVHRLITADYQEADAAFEKYLAQMRGSERVKRDG